MLSLLLSLFILFAPSFTSFNLGNGAELLRSNLLSTLLVGGVFYASLSSTNLIQKEIQQKTILSLLTRPVSLYQIYLGKLLGTFSLLSLFTLLLASMCWFTLVIGTPDTASTKLNFIPIACLCPTLLIGAIVAIALNYSAGINIISFLYGWWALATPVIIFLVLLLSPSFDLPIPASAISSEFVKATLLIHLMILVIASFAISIGTITAPLLNLLLSIAFMFIGLMAPGLEQLSAANRWLHFPTKTLPDFHVFWTAEMISLGHSITLDLMAMASSYAAGMILSFSSLGLYLMMRKDYS